MMHKTQAASPIDPTTMPAITKSIYLQYMVKYKIDFDIKLLYLIRVFSYPQYIGSKQ